MIMKNKPMKPHKQKGFTLIEISIVIIILAIITSLVFPSYRKLVGKAKQTEAKTTLQAIYTAQKLYFAENDKYAINLSDLDIEIPNDARYSYSNSALDNSFSVKAEFNLDQDPALDTWSINEQKVLENTINDLYEE